MTVPPGMTAPAGLPNASLNQRIAPGDPNFPPELHGRTLGDAMRWYGIMRTEFVRQEAAKTAQPPGAPAAAPSGPPPAATPTVPLPAAPNSAPAGDDIEARIARAVATAMGSVLPGVTAASAVSIEQSVKGGFPDWDLYAPTVREMLSKANPEAVLNPETWKAAYFFAKGKALTEAPPAAAPPPAAPMWSSPAGATVTPPPPPPTADRGWFTEGPSAPPPNTNPGGIAPELDPRVQEMARKFNMPVGEYVRWMHGNVPPVVAPGQPAPMQPPPANGGFR